MMYHGYGLGMIGPMFMIAGNVLFWMFLAGAAVLLVRFARQGRLPTTPVGCKRTPREILDERLARGEIDADEYHRRIDALMGPTAQH